MHIHHVRKAEHPEKMRFVNDQTGEQQYQNCGGLQLVPQTLIGIIHVDTLILSLNSRSAA